ETSASWAKLPVVPRLANPRTDKSVSAVCFAAGGSRKFECRNERNIEDLPDWFEQTDLRHQRRIAIGLNHAWKSGGRSRWQLGFFCPPRLKHTLSVGPRVGRGASTRRSAVPTTEYRRLLVQAWVLVCLQLTRDTTRQGILAEQS